MISMTGGTKGSAFSSKSHLGILSGHCFLARLIEHNFRKIDNSETGEKSSFTVLHSNTPTALNGIMSHQSIKSLCL